MTTSGSESKIQGTHEAAGVRSYSSLAHSVVIASVFLVHYVALEWISFIHEFQGVPITPWNPGLGVVFALMLARGMRFAMVLFVGVLLAEVFVLSSDLSWAAIFGLAVIISGVYGGAVAVARRLGIDIQLARLRDLNLLLAVGIGGALIVGVLVSTLLLAAGELVVGDVFTAVGPLIVGDIIGIAVATPLTLRFVLRPGGPPLRSLEIPALEIAIYVAAVVISLWIVGVERSGGYNFFYLLFCPVIVAAVRQGLDGACLTLATAQLGLVGVLHAQGYDVSAFTEFQLLMLVLTATGLVVGVVVSERESAYRLKRAADAKMKNMQMEAVQASRVNLVSGMASALAHEINQPMTAARALGRSAEILVAELKPDLKRVASNLAAMVAQIDHAAAVVRRMREFLRRGGPHVTTLDLAKALEDARFLMSPDLDQWHVGLDLNVAANLPPLHGDRVQLQQVIINLVRNAMEAIVGAHILNGVIRIAATLDRDGRHVVISVRDNGPGIDAARAEQLFGPLTTSKKEGLGLGLAICSSIVEAHAGRLWLHEREAGATEFRISLPLEPIQAT